MTENLPVATIDELTAEIKSRLERGNNILREAALAATAEFITAGERLILVKKLLEHGQWQDWLARNFSLSVDTAQNLMRVAKRFGGAKTEPVRFFNYTQLLQLLPLSSSELPAFLAAMDDAGIAAAGLSKRALREYVKHWRHNHSLTTENPMTIDASAGSGHVKHASKFVAVQPPPPRYEQPSLFANLPAPVTRPQLSLPAEILDAAAEIGVPCYLILRAVHELPAPAVFVAPATSANWIMQLRAQAAAFIQTKLQYPCADDRLATKAVTIFYSGGDVDQFAEHFAKFGDVNIPYTKKASTR